MQDRPAKSRLELPADAVLDPVTQYIYDHFAQLLTPWERAAHRYLTYRSKSYFDDRHNKPGHRDFWLNDLRRDHPGLIEKCEQIGPNAVMAAAAARVVRESSDRIVFNRCPKCDNLCRTPTAKQCLACGHDWHPPEQPS